MSGFFLIPKKGTGGGAEAIPLIVTCSSQFAGTTITASDGTSTLTETCPSTSPYEITFILPNDGSWTISGTVSGQTFTTSIVIQPYETELNAIPEGSTVLPTDDIQTWLFCAGIFDKTYTTISQVLSDSSVVTSLIASNNAADYMARSTTWASSVVADSSAMTKIGANDYCANALLSNSTWLNAICNSSNLESVLNVKIPTMTSNTAPSGLCFASASASGYEVYKAFDQDTSTSWRPNASVASFEGYLGYMFTQKVKVNKMKYLAVAGSQYPIYLHGMIQGSNDNSTWDDVFEIGTTEDPYYIFGETNINIQNNNGFYKYYRLKTIKMTAGTPTISYVGTSIMQLYGRNETA